MLFVLQKVCAQRLNNYNGQNFSLEKTIGLFVMNEEAMRKALRKCVELLGTGILGERSKFRGVISDILPGAGFDNERKLLILAVENFSLGEKLLNAQSGNEDRERCCHYALKEIVDCGLSQDAAETVLQTFTFALGWNVQLAARDSGAGGRRPSSSDGSCAHLNIDFFANCCRDCGKALYGIFEDNIYTPYEAMSKKERNGVLVKIGESYGGVFVVPEHITALEDDCFSEHSNLQDVILPGSLRSIGSFAFENCASLQMLKIPESVTEIGENAFKGLKRVYYNGPAAGSPWGAREHIYKLKSSAKPVFPPVPPLASPHPKEPPAPEPQGTAPVPAPQNSGSDPLALLRSAYANKQVGERFDFGRYPQGPNGEAEPITWRVLRRDSDSLLVISEYGLDAKAYHDRFAWSGISWSKCSLRSWLNGDFINKAFNSQEQSLIKTTRLDNNADPETDDRVFLLSIDEAESLFASDNDRITKPTAYAIKSGAYTKNNGDAWWLLRSSRLSYFAAYVNFGGAIINSVHVSIASGAVRPAFRISL